MPRAKKPPQLSAKKRALLNRPARSFRMTPDRFGDEDAVLPTNLNAVALTAVIVLQELNFSNVATILDFAFSVAGVAVPHATCHMPQLVPPRAPALIARGYRATRDLIMRLSEYDLPLAADIGLTWRPSVVAGQRWARALEDGPLAARPFEGLLSAPEDVLSKRLGSPYLSECSRHWIKSKNPAAPAVKSPRKDTQTRPPNWIWTASGIIRAVPSINVPDDRRIRCRSVVSRARSGSMNSSNLADLNPERRRAVEYGAPNSGPTTEM
jgi:hypothetical protein